MTSSDVMVKSSLRFKHFYDQHEKIHLRAKFEPPMASLKK